VLVNLLYSYIIWCLELMVQFRERAHIYSMMNGWNHENTLLLFAKKKYIYTLLLTSVSDLEALAVLGSCGWHILMFFTLHACIDRYMHCMALSVSSSLTCMHACITISVSCMHYSMYLKPLCEVCSLMSSNYIVCVPSLLTFRQRQRSSRGCS